MSSGQSARLVHRYAIRLSDRQRTELLDVADACDVPISVLLRLAIRWIIAAGPEIFTRPQPPGAPPKPAARFDTAGVASSVDASGALQ